MVDIDQNLHFLRHPLVLMVTVGFYLLLSNPICEQHRSREPVWAGPALGRHAGSDHTRTACNIQHVGGADGNHNLIMVLSQSDDN